ncbi:DNA-directed RNA polymerase subunit E'' [archaeon]|nr:DNA-directed RNA polymerase subunit E'' [archaeon]|tara:strand:- start:1828 stop:2013 length:186 start_codon:yes stop_codon:yes gene_type:complete
MKKKVCKKCKIVVAKDECPICKGRQFTDNWQGRLIVIDPEKSDIAKKIDIKVKGEYAIKIR